MDTTHFYEEVAGAKAWFALEEYARQVGIILPAFPEVFRENLCQKSNHLYASVQQDSLLEKSSLTLLEDLEKKEVENYCIFRFDEHGIASRLLSIYMVYKSLAIFLNLPYGGIGEGVEEQNLVSVKGSLSLFQSILAKLEKKPIEPQKRLVIVFNKRYPGNNGWGWIHTGKKIEWHTSQLPLIDVIENLIANS